MVRSSVILSVTLCLPILSACVHHHHHGVDHPDAAMVRRGGPPPHAPAHGYRKKHHHHGVDLVFDARLGVYVVVGLQDVYFLDENFYRLVEGGGWQASLHPDREWRFVDPASVPPGLTGRPSRKPGAHPAKHRH